MNKKVVIIGVIVIILGIFAFASRAVSQKIAAPNVSPPIAQQQTFSYKGENGKNALTLLKEKTTVEQDSSGLVVSINGRKADEKKHEYWAFYVNGTMAQVGPADYQTKNTDTIDWRITTY